MDSDASSDCHGASTSGCAPHCACAGAKASNWPDGPSWWSLARTKTVAVDY